MSRFRVSLTSLFLLTAIAALVVAFCSSRTEIARLNKEIARLNTELDNVLPLRELEIKSQIERQTAAAKMPVTMIGSLYSGNSYLISFAYYDPQTGAQTSSSFTLRHEQNGHYVGAIRDVPFLHPQPDEDGERGLRISVIDPAFISIAAENDTSTTPQIE